MPWSTGVPSLLEVEGHDAADFAVRVFNLEIDCWEVIHFPLPSSCEGRLRVSHGRKLCDKEHCKTECRSDDQDSVASHVGLAQFVPGVEQVCSSRLGHTIR